MKPSKISALCLVLVLAHPVFANSASSSTSNQSSSPTAYSIDAVDQRPTIQQQARPVYPAALREAHVTGEAKIQFVVDTSGATTQLECLSTTAPEFAESALAAVQQWRFTPAQKNGQAVACRMIVPISFSLPH